MDKLKDLQRRAEEATDQAKIAHTIAEDRDRAANETLKRLKDVTAEVESLKADNDKLRSELKMAKNQSAVLLEENHSVKELFSAMANRLKSTDTISGEEHRLRMEEADRKCRDLEAKSAVLTLEKIEHEKFIEQLAKENEALRRELTNSNQFVAKQIKSEEPFHEEDFDLSRASISSQKSNKQGNLKQSDPTRRGPDAQTIKRPSQTLKNAQAGTHLACLVESRAKDASITAVRKENEDLHRNLMEYRKTAIDAMNQVKELEAKAESLEKENNQLRKQLEQARGQLQSAQENKAELTDTLKRVGQANEVNAIEQITHIRELREKVAALEKELSYKDSELGDLRFRVQRMLEDESKRETAFRESLSKTDALGKTNSHLTNQLQLAKSDAEYLRAQLNRRDQEADAPIDPSQATTVKARAINPVDMSTDPASTLDYRQLWMDRGREVNELKEEKENLRRQLEAREQADARMETLQRELDMLRQSLEQELPRDRRDSI